MPRGLSCNWQTGPVGQMAVKLYKPRPPNGIDRFRSRTRLIRVADGGWGPRVRTQSRPRASVGLTCECDQKKSPIHKPLPYPHRFRIDVQSRSRTHAAKRKSAEPLRKPHEVKCCQMRILGINVSDMYVTKNRDVGRKYYLRRPYACITDCNLLR